MFNKGLKDVIAVQTKIASVEGNLGELRYRGVLINELIPSYSFEEIAYFIWHGVLPDDIELRSIENKLINGRQLPFHVQSILDVLPAEISLMDALRTAISAFAHTHFSTKPIQEQAIILAGAIPVIVAKHYRKYNLPP